MPSIYFANRTTCFKPCQVKGTGSEVSQCDVLRLLQPSNFQSILARSQDCIITKAEATTLQEEESWAWGNKNKERNKHHNPTTGVPLQ